MDEEKEKKNIDAETNWWGKLHLKENIDRMRAE